MTKTDYSETFSADGDENLESQTFAPRPVEPPKLPARLRRRQLRSLQGLTETAKNRYEAVLIAAARARQLNSKKLALEERGLEDEVGELKRMKMTSFALDELLDKKIDVQRTDDEL